MRFFQHGAHSFNWSEEYLVKPQIKDHNWSMTIWRKKFINLSPSVLLSKEFSNQAEMLNKRKLIEWELWSHLVKIPDWIEEAIEPPEIFLSLSSKSPEHLNGY